MPSLVIGSALGTVVQALAVLVIGEDPELDAQRFYRSPNGVVLVTRRMLANL